MSQNASKNLPQPTQNRLSYVQDGIVAHLGRKMAPEIANLAEIVHLVPLLATSWAQHRPTWSARCLNKSLQDARIAKNIKKLGQLRFLLSQPCAKTLPKCSPNPPKIVQVTSKMAPKPPKLRPRWPS